MSDDPITVEPQKKLPVAAARTAAPVPATEATAATAAKTVHDNETRSRKNRRITFVALGVLLLIVVGLMTWQSFLRSKQDGQMHAGWWIGSVSTLVLGSLALFLGYRASEPSWSESIGKSLEKLVAFTESLSSGVDRIDSASDRVQKTLLQQPQQTKQNSQP